MSEPLHQRQPTTRFSDRAADYVKYRPSYPAEAIEAILEGLAPVSLDGGTNCQPMREGGVLRAVDVGAGTGISARLLADRGVHVIAIEPNSAMRQAGETPTPRDVPIDWRAGTAEATGLAAGSVDLVLCAQSYHWFEPVAACRELGRILRPGGRLALMWNDADESEPVSRGYYDLVRAASGGVGPTSHQTVAKDPIVAPPFDAARTRRLRFRNEQRLDADGLIGRAMSASYVPREGEKAERLVAGLRELHADHVGADGCVGLVYGVWVYLCDIAGT